MIPNEDVNIQVIFELFNSLPTNERTRTSLMEVIEASNLNENEKALAKIFVFAESLDWVSFEREVRVLLHGGGDFAFLYAKHALAVRLYYERGQKTSSAKPLSFYEYEGSKLLDSLAAVAKLLGNSAASDTAQMILILYKRLWSVAATGSLTEDDPRRVASLVALFDTIEPDDANSIAQEEILTLTSMMILNDSISGEDKSRINAFISRVGTSHRE